MKRIIAMLLLSASFMFAAINLQTASKEELMTIKGIGEKKAEAIMKYRKTNKIKNADDLKNIKGFGDGLVENVKKDVKVTDAKKAVKEKTTKKAEKATKTIEKKTTSTKTKEELLKTKK